MPRLFTRTRESFFILKTYTRARGKPRGKRGMRGIPLVFKGLACPGFAKKTGHPGQIGAFLRNIAKTSARNGRGKQFIPLLNTVTQPLALRFPRWHSNIAGQKEARLGC